MSFDSSICSVFIIPSIKVNLIVEVEKVMLKRNMVLDMLYPYRTMKKSLGIGNI